MSTHTSTLSDVPTDELLVELGNRISALGLLDHPLGADVEVLDVLAPGQQGLKPSVVRVNGTDVGLLARDGIKLDAGDAYFPASVTLTLLPRSVTLKAV